MLCGDTFSNFNLFNDGIKMNKVYRVVVEHQNGRTIVCDKKQIEDVICLGLRPPKYIKEYKNVV